jgi:hypothetical protein
MKKFLKANQSAILIACMTVALASNASAADLTAVTTGATNFINSLARLLNIGAALLGGWFVVSGVMNWKKSTNEQGGGQIEMKSIVVPIITGAILVAFTGFIAMTSSTFGFAGTTSSIAWQ